MTDDELPEGLPEKSEASDPREVSRDAKPWLDLITRADKVFKTYHDKADGIDRLYANLERLANVGRDREFQIFWANLEVLRSSIYSRVPVPVVVGRFKDRKPLVRHASELQERCLIASFDMGDIHQTLELTSDDLAINSRGVLWPRYEADDEGERVCYDHLDRKDFLHDPARKWSEVGWVSRRSWLTLKAGEERFGKVWKDAAFVDKDTDKSEGYRGEKKAPVYEIWHKEQRLVVWVSPGIDVVLDMQDPFLKLDRFFPCPQPAYGTLERGSLVPVPDMMFYRDQMEEINELTARISSLAEGLKLRGFYAGGKESIADAIEKAIKSSDNRQTLIPVASFDDLGGPGLKDSIVWLPLDMVATTIQQLIALRKELIQDVYEITGISDIMRGSTEASETLGAQQLKSQYGSVRVRKRQSEMVRIARDAARIAGEIMAENFQQETLLAMSQYEALPTDQQIAQKVQGIQMQIQQAQANPEIMAQAQANPQMAQEMLQKAQQEMQAAQQELTIDQVVAFLRDQRMRPFTLEIETDSTIQPDEDSAKQRSTEFLGALAQALSQLAPMVERQPQSAEFASEVLKFAVAPFRAGRALEGAIDQFADQVKQVAGQGKPDPEAEARKAEADMKTQELQATLQTMQMKSAADAQQAAADLEKTRAEIQKIFAEISRINAQAAAPKMPTGTGGFQ